METKAVGKVRVSKIKESIIDYGKWTTPKSWDELDLKTFGKIQEYYSDKDKKFDIRDVISILCNKTEDEVNGLPFEFAEKLMEQFAWMSEEPKSDKPTNKVEIDGVEYKVNTQEKLKVGEYVAIDTVLKNDKFNYPLIMAILCRKEDEKYDSHYENEVLPQRIGMWEKVSVTKVLPVIGFFLSSWLISENNTQLYSKAEETLNLIAKNIETSRRNGHLSVLSTISLKRKLKKLRKSMKAISQTSYN